jgi:hypothetical protein
MTIIRRAVLLLVVASFMRFSIVDHQSARDVAVAAAGSFHQPPPSAWNSAAVSA